MGEYAGYKGQQIKMGTCENMYYLRYEDRAKVTPESGNVNPVTDAEALRFRFPFPDEDGLEPGSGVYHDNGFHRGIPIWGYSIADGVEHSTKQFRADPGYLVSLPCPESSAYDDVSTGARAMKGTLNVRVHRNGTGAPVQLVAQKFRPGIGLVPILRCTGCGEMWREEDRSRIEELAMCLRAEADKQSGRPDFWHQLADRVLADLNVTE